MPSFDKSKQMKKEWLTDEAFVAKKIEEANSHIWTEKHGRKIHIEDMSDSYLKKVYYWLENRSLLDFNLPWLSVVKEEIRRRVRENEYESTYWESI